jgi:hypothetical protein
MKTPAPIAKDGIVTNFTPRVLSQIKSGQTFKTLRGDIEYLLVKPGLIMEVESMEERYFPTSMPVYLISKL